MKLVAFSLLLAALAFAPPTILADANMIDLDKDASFIGVKTYRSGLLSYFAGHDHAILAKNWIASVCYDPKTPRNSSADLSIPAALLEIDTPEARRIVGLDDNGPSEDERLTLQERMLGPEILSAQVYPEITFRTSSVHPEGDGLALAGPLRVRGQIRVQVAHLRVENLEGDNIRFSGMLEFKQSSYGIEPPSVGRMVSVKDAMEIHFRIEGRRTDKACERLSAWLPH